MRVTVRAQPRSPLTKGGIKKLRQSGWVPVTVSAPATETLEFAAQRRELADALHHYGPSALIELALPSGKRLVIARDVQRQSVTGQLLHVGFLGVSELQPVSAEVTLRLVGEPEAVRAGTAVLEQQVTTLHVRALPDRLPAHVDVNTSAMEVGGVLHVRDIAMAGDIEMLTDADAVIATVHTVRAAVAELEEEEAAAEGAPAAQSTGAG